LWASPALKQSPRLPGLVVELVVELVETLSRHTVRCVSPRAVRVGEGRVGLSS